MGKPVQVCMGHMMPYQAEPCMIMLDYERVDPRRGRNSMHCLCGINKMRDLHGCIASSSCLQHFRHGSRASEPDQRD